MPLTSYSGALADYAKGGVKSRDHLLVEGASFTGAVTVACLAFEQPVVFRRCVFANDVDLRQRFYGAGWCRAIWCWMARALGVRNGGA